MPKSYGQVKGKRYPCTQPIAQPRVRATIYDPVSKPSEAVSKKPGPKRVIVDGKRTFDTIKQASMLTGVSEYFIRRSIRERVPKGGHRFELLEDE